MLPSNLRLDLNYSVIPSAFVDLPAPPDSEADHNQPLLSRLINVMSCLAHSCICRGSHQCEKSASVQLHILKNLERSPTTDLIKKTHAICSGDSPRPGNFRVGRVSVGAGNHLYGFTTALIDVDKRLRITNQRLKGSFKNRPTVVALTIFYALSILHPFEDGNGRTMRCLIPICASLRNKKYLAFWIYFSLYIKLTPQASSHALLSLQNQQPDEVRNFYMRAVSDFEQFLREICTSSVDTSEEIFKKLKTSISSNHTLLI